MGHGVSSRPLSLSSKIGLIHDHPLRLFVTDCDITVAHSYRSLIQALKQITARFRTR